MAWCLGTRTHLLFSLFTLLTPCISDHVLSEGAIFMPKHVALMSVQLHIYDTVLLFGCSND